MAGNETSVVEIVMGLEEVIRVLQWNVVDKYVPDDDEGDRLKGAKELKKGNLGRVLKKEAERLSGTVNPEIISGKLNYLNVLVKKVSKRAEHVSNTEKDV